jgi:hypothetical protein
MPFSRKQFFGNLLRAGRAWIFSFTGHCRPTNKPYQVALAKAMALDNLVSHSMPFFLSAAFPTNT